MTKDEYIQALGRSLSEDPFNTNGCLGKSMMYGFIIAALIICTMCSCRTTSSTEQTVDYRHMMRVSEKIDSLIHATATWQQSIYQKQTSLVDSFKQKEVRDTSHTYFLGVKGDTVKEKIIIREYIESNHSSQESTQELREEFFRQTDSLIAINKALSEKMDTAIQSHNKETVVTKEPSLGDKIKWFAGGIVLAVIGGFAIFSAFIRKK